MSTVLDALRKASESSPIQGATDVNEGIVLGPPPHRPPPAFAASDIDQVRLLKTVVGVSSILIVLLILTLGVLIRRDGPAAGASDASEISSDSLASTVAPVIATSQALGQTTPASTPLPMSVPTPVLPTMATPPSASSSLNALLLGTPPSLPDPLPEPSPEPLLVAESSVAAIEKPLDSPKEEKEEEKTKAPVEAEATEEDSASRAATLIEGLKIHGIVWNETRSVAMVNDSILTVGSHLGEAAVVEIKPSAIILEIEGKQYTITQ